MNVPKNRIYCDITISNANHGLIPDGLEATLKGGGFKTTHYAWDFFGIIWFADGQFYEKVMQYGRHVGSFSADSLHDLVQKVNDEYGDN